MDFVILRRLVKHIPALVLAVVALWLLARIGLTAWEMTQIEPPEGNTRQAAVAGRSGNVDAPGSTLFGTPPPQGKLGGEPGLPGGGNLRLSGVVASNDKRVAHAIIETGGISGTYFSGDTVAAGMTLQEVRPNEVLLQRSGEVLHLPLAGLSSGAGGGSPPNQDARQDLDYVADILAEPPQVILSEFVRMEPIMDTDGRMAGYRIFPRAQSDSLDSLGLVPGDLVVAVNGIPFEMDNIATAREQMNSGGDMMLSVMREGEQMEVNVGSENSGLLVL